MSETSSPSMQAVFEQNMALWQQTQTQIADWMQDSFQSAHSTHQTLEPTPLFAQMVGTDALFGADRKALAFVDALMKLASTGSELNGSRLGSKRVNATALPMLEQKNLTG